MSLSEVLPGRQAMTHPGSWWSSLWSPPKATSPTGYFGGDLLIRLFPLPSDLSRVRERGLWHLPSFSCLFLGEIRWRRKVWRGGCCSPRPILNHGRAAGAFNDQDERDTWGMAGVSRADSEKAGRLTKTVPASSFLFFYFLIPSQSTELT